LKISWNGLALPHPVGYTPCVKRVVEKEWNFLIGDRWTTPDWEVLFGPLNRDEFFLEPPDQITFPEILKLTGVFPSTTAARKNGWGECRLATFKNFPRRLSTLVDKPGLWIPEGFTDFFAGKGKATRITILKMTLTLPAKVV